MILYSLVNNQYYLFEKVALERFPGSEGSYNVKWTINTIDISIYDKFIANSNIYGNSYIKKYLEEVVKAKMGVTSVSLPKWKGRESLYQAEVGSYDKSALKYKKITDYTIQVQKNYQSIRNVKSEVDNEWFYTQLTRLQTQNAGNSDRNFCIREDGTLGHRGGTHGAFGIRPAIEY